MEDQDLQNLIDQVIGQMMDDMMCEDYTAIQELLMNVDPYLLKGYLSEVQSYIGRVE